MGKLDAIFAKLKNKKAVDGQGVTDGPPESNNNSKEQHDFNYHTADFSSTKISPLLSGSSRRKSRKSKPRNIAEFSSIENIYEKEVENDIDNWSGHSQNNSDLDIDERTTITSSRPITPTSSQTFDVSSEHESTFLPDNLEDSRDTDKLVIDESEDNELMNIPLDLTVTKTHKDKDDQIDTADIADTAENFDTPPTADKSSPSLISEPSSPSFPPTGAKLLNNTMNELLKMYGLGASPPDNQDKLQLTKYHVAQLAATASLGLLPKLQSTNTPTNNLLTSSPQQLNGHVFSQKKGLFSSGPKMPFLNYNGFLPNAKTSSGHTATVATSKPSNLKGLGSNRALLPDYTKYLKRFSNGSQCGNSNCKELGYREHYHCLDCCKVYVKKEEMVRHFKWHKKREDSLQHGFMRYSPMDNCQPKFGICTHNGRQTHYHCLQKGCDKVYISTSDVQMHANYHRKDSAIILEGFQRFRATEDCGTTSCSFYGQRTTHFHCRRTGCNFTFKNKADMEKHKTYHQKDEILAKDGFKKFMKYESCSFKGCKYTKISNHIHCIRPGCDYVLHSTAQLYSHKRKHERRDFESAYQNYRNTQRNGVGLVSQNGTAVTQPQVLTTSISPTSSLIQTATSMSLPVQISSSQSLVNGVTTENKISSGEKETKPDVTEAPAEEKKILASYSEQLTGEKLNDSLTLPIPRLDRTTMIPTKPVTKTGLTASSLPDTVKSTSERKDRDESWKSYLIRYTANDPCSSRCVLLYKDHYHCRVEGCNHLFRGKDGVREHSKLHEQQDRISPHVYESYDAEEKCKYSDCPLSGQKKHHHCTWTNCNHVIEGESNMFARLEHYRIHEYAKLSAGRANKNGLTSLDKQEEDVSRRRRGRPPKYPRSLIPSVPKVNLSDDEITDSVQRFLQGDVDESSKIINGFQKFEASETCPDDLCQFVGKDHYHCARNRCYTSTDRMDVVNLHAKDFHNFVTIQDGYEFFDRYVNCRRAHCHNNKANRHFHCTRPGCDYSFVRHNTMTQHEKKHSDQEVSANNKMQSTVKKMSNFVPIVPAAPTSIDLKNKNIVKAAGTFYPLSGLNNNMPTLMSVSLPNMVSVCQPNMTSSAGLVSPTSSATILPIQVPTLSIVPQLFVPATQTIQALLPVNMSSEEGNSSALPLLLQKQNKEDNQSPETPTNILHFTSNQSCCRPFCKLKKKAHYHCAECNQAFSDPIRLRNHMMKHGLRIKREAADGGMDLSPPSKRMKCSDSLSVSSNVRQDEADLTSSSLNLDPTVFSSMWRSAEMCDESKVKIKREPDDTMISTSDMSSIHSASEDDQDVTSDLSRWSAGKKAMMGHEDYINDETSPKVDKLYGSRTKQDIENLQEGYSRYRFNEDCEYMKCAYKHSSTHYHCLRADCGYGFSDRSRLVQHTLRHERIDKIMGNEFRQFRASVHCTEEGCEFSAKSSHFHCLKCSFSCADSSKVSAHRKHHLKLDNISSKGFVKFIGSQDCEIPFCAHSKKQTHYHCTFLNCNHAVLGPAQMAPHKLKHSLKMEKHS